MTMTSGLTGSTGAAQMGAPWAGAAWAGGAMELRLAAAQRHLDDCTLCPHRCGEARATATGRCRIGRDAYIASEMMHMGEESILRPTHAIFFSGCTATCTFCTAARFAFHPTYGVVVAPEALAERILQRQAQGARSVAFIGGDPVPHLPFIVAVRAALGDRLAIPLVLNTNLYVTPEALALADGVVDLYLPDLKFGPATAERDCGDRLGGMPAYWENVTGALATLHAQGKRLLVRHLLMPGHLACCTVPALTWLAGLPGVEVSLLTQYLAPAHARGELARPLAADDVQAARRLAAELGLALVE
jgi:putative pyruvate formate lyase activating enzyme